jgi:hypothetical protein
LADVARELGMKPESAWQGIFGAASWFARAGIVLHYAPPALGERLCAPLDGVRLRLTDATLTPDLEIEEQEADGAEDVAQVAFLAHPGAAEWSTRRRLILRNITVLRRILAAGDRQHGVTAGLMRSVDWALAVDSWPSWSWSCLCGCRNPLLKKACGSCGTEASAVPLCRVQHHGRWLIRHPLAGSEWGYRFEHMLVAEAAMGKPLPRNALVHHVDEDPLNNANTNLVVCPGNQYHRIIHLRLEALKATGNANSLRCTYCKGWGLPPDVERDSSKSFHRKCYHAHWRAWRARNHDRLEIKERARWERRKAAAKARAA